MRSSSFFARSITHSVAASLVAGSAVIAACTPASRDFGSGAGAAGSAATGVGGGSGGMTGSSSVEVSSTSGAGGAGGAGGSAPLMTGDLIGARGFIGDALLFDLAAAGDGDTVIAGRFAGAIDIDGTNLVDAGGSDLFVARHDNKAKLKFARSYGDASPSGAIHAATGPLSGTYLAGELVDMGNLDFGGAIVGGPGAWIAGLNAMSNPVFTLGIPSPSASPTPYAVAANETGNGFVAGYFMGSLVVAGTTLTSLGDTDAFYLKTDPGGSVLWARRAGGMGHDNATGVAVDATDNVYLTGYYENSITFAMGGGIGSSGGSDVFVAKLGQAGALKWSKGIGGPGNEFIFGTMALTPAGEVVIAASAMGDIVVEGKSLPQAGGNDVYIVKLTTDGSMLWAQRYGDGGSQDVSGVAVDPDGNILLTGTFDGSLDFGSGPLTAGFMSRGYIAKLDPSGAPIFAKAFDGQINSLRVAADGKSSVILAGSGKNIAFTPGSPLTSAVGGVFVARFVP